jgi:RNA polymerase sigma factor (sigma-70 family)
MRRRVQLDYETFFLAEYPKVVSFLCKVGFGADQAEDAVQEAMISALVQWPIPDERRKGWIRLAAKRVAVRDAEQVRRERPRLVAKGYGVRTLNGLEAELMVDAQDELLRILWQLPAPEREVVAWHLDGFTAKEIASQMGLRSASEARVRLSRARKKIAKLLDGGTGRRGGAE